MDVTVYQFIFLTITGCGANSGAVVITIHKHTHAHIPVAKKPSFTISPSLYMLMSIAMCHEKFTKNYNLL